MHGISIRNIATLALVGVLVISAGCSGIGIGGSNTEATDTTGSPAADGPTEGDDSTQSSSDGSSNTTDGEGSAEGTTGESGSGDGHDHDHDHDHGGESDGPGGADGDADQNETVTADENGTDSGELTTSSAESWGWVTIAVDGTKLDLSQRDESGDPVGIGDEKFIWLAAEDDVTLSEALSYFGIDAGASRVTVDGEQYSAQDEGTSISYRVDGNPVDPEEYELQNHDEIWMVVETDDMGVETPGEYISIDEPHAHGGLSFVVDGEEVDFSKDRYQTNADHFHFEGGDGEEWHAHSWSVTLEWALSSLDGIDVDGDTVTYDDTTYDASEGGTSVEITVNGESVEPGEYILKDGDSVEVVVNSDG